MASEGKFINMAEGLGQMGFQELACSFTLILVLGRVAMRRSHSADAGINRDYVSRRTNTGSYGFTKSL